MLCRNIRIQVAATGLAAVFLWSTACLSISVAKNEAPSIIGTWLVKIPDAPFPYHMFVFHSDETMQQSNLDAGNPNISDSDGVGVWTPVAGRIKGKFVDVTADRMTRRFVSRGEISFLSGERGCSERHCERGLLRRRGAKKRTDR